MALFKAPTKTLVLTHISLNLFCMQQSLRTLNTKHLLHIIKGYEKQHYLLLNYSSKIVFHNDFTYLRIQKKIIEKLKHQHKCSETKRISN